MLSALKSYLYSIKLYSHIISLNFFVFLIFCISSADAQVASDGTLNTGVIEVEKSIYTINGGRQRGANLFHSFNEFSIPRKGSVMFNTSDNIRSIFSRVTGNSVSNIDGAIKVQGDVDLFLINPHGIIFGQNASLEVGGSFFASTASQINFLDGTFFSSTNSAPTVILTMSTPIGLQFGQTAGSITNSSIVEDETGFQVGLQINPENTLGLIGNGVDLINGIIFAPGARIEIGSVNSNNLVSLLPDTQGWSLEYDSVNYFNNIHILQNSFIDISGETSGNIVLNGRNILIRGRSGIFADNLGNNLGSFVDINASHTVELNEVSSIFASAFSSGRSGDVAINAKHLILRDSAFIDVSNQANGQAGNLSVHATNSVEINDSQLSTQTFGDTDSGTLNLKTKYLSLLNGGQISSSGGDGAGSGGDINITVDESLEVIGTVSNEFGEVQRSGIFSESVGEGTTGNGGNLIISTKSLNIQDGGSISVAASENSEGQAGSLIISALENIIVNGNGSIISAQSESPKPAGNISINTDILSIEDGGIVSVSTNGSGAAGQLQIKSNILKVDGISSRLLSTSSNIGNGGNILATTNQVKLSNGAGIGVFSTGEGRGGNIQLDNVSLITLDDQAFISSEASSTIGGNINIKGNPIILLNNNSKISAAVGDFGIGGNIEITANIVAAVPNSNSDIIANSSQGTGGNITLTTQGLFGFQTQRAFEGNLTNDLDTSSEFGITGMVSINNPETDPSQSLFNLPTSIIQATKLLEKSCKVNTSKETSNFSSFIVTGQGGLSASPQDFLSHSSIVENWLTFNHSHNSFQKKDNIKKFNFGNVAENGSENNITEAIGWIRQPNGNLLLTSQNSRSLLNLSRESHHNC